MRSSMQSSTSTWLGQLFFSVMSHQFYDLGLYRFVTGSIWRCPTERLMDSYLDNISNNHLEVGVGSGYFLERTLSSNHQHRLVLLDLNQRCLAKSADRLKSFAPAIRHQNILEPLASAEASFLSVGMNYVLHCIPGGFRGNERMFEHIHSVLETDGVFFGATLLKRPLSDGPAAWLFMRFLNTIGIFCNEDHNVKELRDGLESCFRDVQISIVGNAAIFRAVK